MPSNLVDCRSEVEVHKHFRCNLVPGMITLIADLFSCLCAVAADDLLIPQMGRHVTLLD
jgi:hypothetical protein